VAISARASHALHRALGDEPAEDVVNWMHHTDDSRVELRELNDANYTRVDGRIPSLEARMDARFAAVDARFDALTGRMDARFAAAALAKVLR
jgi:hypothetical protein